MASSFTLAVLFSCLLGLALFQTGLAQTGSCPANWRVRCSRPLSDFTEVKRPRKFCNSIGHAIGDSCVIAVEDLPSVIPNGCCEAGR